MLDYREKVASLGAHVHPAEDGEFVHVDDVDPAGLPGVDVRFPPGLDVMPGLHGAEGLLEPIGSGSVSGPRPEPSSSLFLKGCLLFLLLGDHHLHPLLEIDDEALPRVTLQATHDLGWDVIGLGQELIVEGLEYVLGVEPAAPDLASPLSSGQEERLRLIPM